jgi:tetratricopeptide (TPR) repeat protein
LDRFSDSLIQKAQIISNLNRDSSLSLRVAEKKYGDENYDESAALLETYLGKFPFNSTAQILLSKTYAQLGKYHQAVQFLKSAKSTIHSPKTFDFYLKEIEDIQRRDKVVFDSITFPKLDYKISDDFNQNEIIATDEPRSYDVMLVSETLAKIYISQGELKEALKIYEKLIERKPESREKYLQSIEELKSRLEK